MGFCARRLIDSNTIGTPNYLIDEQIEELEMQILRLIPEIGKVYCPSDEREIRNQKIVHNATGLIIS